MEQHTDCAIADFTAILIITRKLSLRQ